MAMDGFLDAIIKLASNLIWVGIIIVIGSVLFFGSRYYGKISKEKKAYNITAFISHPDGSHTIDIIGKFKKEDMQFLKFKKSKETMPVINPAYIVNKSVHLFRYGPEQYAIIPPKIYRNLDISKFDIQLIDLDVLTFKGLEQRQAISRWAKTKDALMQWAPWITVITIFILAGVAIWFLTTMGMYMFDKVSAQRTLECSQIVKSGVETIKNNVNTPVG